MSKNYTFSEINRLKVAKSVEKEFEHYRHLVCRKSKKQIFEASGKNSFYELVKSYFTDCGTIADETTNRLAGNKTIIEDLWQIYARTEGYGVSTWDDVHDLVLLYFEDARRAANY